MEKLMASEAPTLGQELYQHLLSGGEAPSDLLSDLDLDCLTKAELTVVAWSVRSWPVKEEEYSADPVEKEETPMQQPMHKDTVDKVTGEASIKKKQMAERTDQVLKGMAVASVSNNAPDPLKNYVPPPRPSCPSCMVTMPIQTDEQMYNACCGKLVCIGCQSALVHKCPFCHCPSTSDDAEIVKRLEKRAQVKDAFAIVQLGSVMEHGLYGINKDQQKAFEHYTRAHHLGDATAALELSRCYFAGVGVKEDMDKAWKYANISAERGDVGAHHLVGIYALEQKRDAPLAMRQFRMGAACGDDICLEAVKVGYKNGHVTKDEFATSLRAFYAAQQEMKSEARTKASNNIKN